MVDLDDFKGVNDTHGHATGDTVLANFVRRVKTPCRLEAFLAAWAGKNLPS